MSEMNRREAPVPRCDLCRFWDPPAAPLVRGTCEHMGLRMFTGPNQYDHDVIWTAPDFGCVQHEPREPDV